MPLTGARALRSARWAPTASMVSRLWRGQRIEATPESNVQGEQRPELRREAWWMSSDSYLDPPRARLGAHASTRRARSRALDRTQRRRLPIYLGRCETMTHDYKRNGTTTLFAALNVAEARFDRRRGMPLTPPPGVHQVPSGRSIAEDAARAGPAPDRRQLRDAQTPQRPEVAEASSPVPHALHPHEQFVAEPTSRAAGSATSPISESAGVFKSVEQLIAAIQAYIDNHNSDPKPFVWIAKAEDILEKVGRARAVLDKITSD